MLPYKKILYPTDFSEPSYEALKVANELALHFSSELLVLHVVAPVPLVAAAPAVPPTFDVVRYQQDIEMSSGKILEDLVKKRVPEKIWARTMVVLGDPADQIVKIADEEKVDLVVIATYGQTGWRRFVFGSVTEKVVRLASQPVLTIRAPQTEE
ncbi:MAG: universal stress protein [Proteobacteria bacterium]|nr:universal stress protein [Pseudomonadota bacterium]